MADILVKETGKQWHIKLVDGKAGNNTPASAPKANSNPINDLGIDINVIEWALRTVYDMHAFRAKGTVFKRKNKIIETGGKYYE